MILAGVFTLAAMLAGCDNSLSDDDNTNAIVTYPPGVVRGVVLSQNQLKLYINGKESMSAVVLPPNVVSTAVTWESSDTSVATVDQNGMVTGIDGGTATITVRTVEPKANGEAATTTAVVTVEPNDWALFRWSVAEDGIPSSDIPANTPTVIKGVPVLAVNAAITATPNGYLLDGTNAGSATGDKYVALLIGTTDSTPSTGASAPQGTLNLNQKLKITIGYHLYTGGVFLLFVQNNTGGSGNSPVSGSRLFGASGDAGKMPQPGGGEGSVTISFDPAGRTSRELLEHGFINIRSGYYADTGQRTVLINRILVEAEE
jgi:hypothetical protein